MSVGILLVGLGFLKEVFYVLFLFAVFSGQDYLQVWKKQKWKCYKQKQKQKNKQKQK